ncbi:MAG TPA: outer membrane beta-barrel protein [Thermodesulfobacteriota bacterium]|nr:outer membrane beta-barrel protein [Thermodesulfobacteriota bacterium]
MKVKIGVIGIMILCLAVGFSLPAQAQTVKGNYGVLKGGIYSPQNSNLDQFGTGFNGELAFGHYFSKNFALEFGSGYFQTNRNSSGNFGNATLTFNVVPVILTLKGIIPLDKSVELYGLGGGGAYFLWTSTSASANNQYYYSSSADNTTLAGGFLGMGINFKITPTVFLGLEGKYLWTSNVTLKNYNNTYSYTTDVNLNGIQATFNVGFLF